MKTKKLAVLTCCVLLLVGVVGGTLAWLIDKDGPVTNEFTPSNVDVTLTETQRTYQMVPGYTLPKDPTVTVSATSESVYLFVKVEELGGNVTVKENDKDVTKSFGDFISYEMADGWIAGDGENGVPVGVYFRIVNEGDAEKVFAVLKDNEVTVKDTVTKEMMDELQKDAAKDPKLQFTAYVSQLYKTNPETAENQFSAAQAWANLGL